LFINKKEIVSLVLYFGQSILGKCVGSIFGKYAEPSLYNKDTLHFVCIISAMKSILSFIVILSLVGIFVRASLFDDRYVPLCYKKKVTVTAGLCGTITVNMAQCAMNRTIDTVEEIFVEYINKAVTQTSCYDDTAQFCSMASTEKQVNTMNYLKPKAAGATYCSQYLCAIVRDLIPTQCSADSNCGSYTDLSNYLLPYMKAYTHSVKCSFIKKLVFDSCQDAAEANGVAVLSHYSDCDNVTVSGSFRSAHPNILMTSWAVVILMLGLHLFFRTRHI
jgi:hypothetical protein